MVFIIVIFFLVKKALVANPTALESSGLAGAGWIWPSSSKERASKTSKSLKRSSGETTRPSLPLFFLELQNLWIEIFYTTRNRRSTDLEALKL